MQYPYYELSVPILIKNLTNLDNLMRKAEAFRDAGNMDEETILNSRLAPDMFPFIKQITIASDNAKGIAARLAGVEIPVMEDTETSFAELHARIAKTIEFLKTLTPVQFENAADQQVTLKYFPGKYFTGHGYLTEYGLPNFFFHVTTAYDILRSIGLQIGKSDFMGGLPLIDSE